MLEDRDARREDELEVLAVAMAVAHHEPKNASKLFSRKPEVEKGDVVWWGKGPEAARAAVEELFADDPDPEPDPASGVDP